MILACFVCILLAGCFDAVNITPGCSARVRGVTSYSSTSNLCEYDLDAYSYLDKKATYLVQIGSTYKPIVLVLPCNTFKINDTITLQAVPARTQ